VTTPDRLSPPENDRFEIGDDDLVIVRGDDVVREPSQEGGKGDTSGD